MNYPTAQVGYQNQQPCSPPTDKSRLEMIFECAESMDSQLQTASQRLRTIADRLLGSVPEAVSENKTGTLGGINPSQSPICTRIDSANHSARNNIDALFRQIDRLERL